MRLPAIRRFLSEDFSGITSIPAFCSKLFFPLNSVLNVIYSGFNNGLTLGDNTVSMVKVVSVVPTSLIPGTSTTWLSFPWSYQSPPVGVVVMQALNSSGAPVAAGALGVKWSYSSGQVQIQNIFGLPADSNRYTLTLWVSGG